MWSWEHGNTYRKRHYNPLLIRDRSWIRTTHQAEILRKKPLAKTFLDFKKLVKSIQTAGYNGARTVNWMFYIKFPYHITKKHWLLSRVSFNHEILSAWNVSIWVRWPCTRGGHIWGHWYALSDALVSNKRVFFCVCMFP